MPPPLRLLLEAGADKDAATTTYGATALMSAAEEGHLEVVRLLIEAGAFLFLCICLKRTWIDGTRFKFESPDPAI